MADLLRERIQAALHLGVLRPGDRLASVRQLADELHRRSAAILEAYHQLADEGLVELRSRSGVFVAPPSRREDLPPIASSLLDVFLHGVSQGSSPLDLQRQALACLDGPPPSAACLECNDDQLFSLCGQLRGDFGFDARPHDLAGRAPRPAAADAAQADLIVTTRFHADDAQALARRANKPVVVATLDTSFLTEVHRLLAAGPVWWICTDPRFTAKLSRMFPRSHITPLVLGRDRLDAVPPGAMVYATRRAAERLPRGWRRGQVVTVTRTFSRDTVRELLAFRFRRALRAEAGSRRRA